MPAMPAATKRLSSTSAFRSQEKRNALLASPSGQAASIKNLARSEAHSGGKFRSALKFYSQEIPRNILLIR
ncbi:unnamed protein product [Clonostachys rosea]|uniref:Uncharacterized protein n=1 Tax=Bionectria ochroleuca TaxID=29856 RepID=A0ABY6UHZ4_BIOOC|nr:unnamed protein product [Clonostachys rosea]